VKDAFGNSQKISSIEKVILV
jgi:hypothetical protein